MRRERKIFWAKTAVILGAIPFLIWAHEYGPDVGYCGVPKENGTCAQAACHLGTANNPANQGTVKVNLPNGMAYNPGVKQHLTVTISDPAPTQKAWGFQLTARTSSNSATMAGTFASTDANTLTMCATSDLIQEKEVDFNAGTPQVCPANMPLQYIEHSLNGYQASLGKTGSFTYEFDWNPPSTNVGNVIIYVAGNAGAGNLTTSGAHIYTSTFTLTPGAGGSGPTIDSNGVVNGASFQPGLTPNAWVTITGNNLASTTDTWDKAIVNNQLPNTLDGVSVSIGGQPAYVYFISQKQINVVAPNVAVGPVQVTVTNNGSSSAAVTANSAQYGPAFFLWASKYPVATRQDGSLAVKNGTFSTTTVAAKPGDVLILWGTGFGLANPVAPVGVPLPSDKLYSTASPVSVTINGAQVQVFGAALAPGFAALYQVAIQVPSDTPDGDYPIVATVNGAQSPTGVVLTVQH
jgi:uncharacterized protein (TIGR03437 family)